MCSLNSSISNFHCRVLGLTNAHSNVLLSCPGLAALQLSPACLHLAGVNSSFPCVFFIFQVHMGSVQLYYYFFKILYDSQIWSTCLYVLGVNGITLNPNNIKICYKFLCLCITFREKCL